MDLSAPSRRFVGRQEELAALARAHEAASKAQPGIVCIEGPPGIGKTALLRRFLVDVQPQTALSASGDEAESGLPWGVLSQLAHAPQSERCGALRHLQSLTPDFDPLGAGRLLLEALGSLQLEQPVVLVVEDLHWVDQPSARALRFALRRLTADQVLVVLTTRQEGHLHAEEGWQRLIEDRGQRLRLVGLDPGEIAELASWYWSAPASAVVARRLWEHSEGNPFYLRCLIEELDPAVIEASRGPFAIPRSLAAVLVSRLGACSAATQELVCAAAVLGERCSLAPAVALAGIADGVGALDEAVRVNLLIDAELDGVRQVAFPHPLVRSAVYSDLSPARRAALHLKAAELTTGTASLVHRAAAATGPDEHLADELAAVAKAESARGAYAAAARHMMRAADLSVQADVSDARLLFGLARWLLAGETHEVSSRRSLLESLPPSPERDLVRGRLAWFEGRIDESRRAVEAASRQISPSDQRRASVGSVAWNVAWSMANLVMLDWDCETALRLVEGFPESHGASFVRCHALSIAGRTSEAWGALGTLEGSSSRLAQALEVAARYYVMMYSDDLVRAKTELEAFVDNPTVVLGSLLPVAQTQLSEIYYRLGNLDDALVTAELALSLLREAGMSGTAEAVLAAVKAAWAASAAGNWPAADRNLAIAEAESGSGAPRVLRAHTAAARWSLALARDDVQAMVTVGSAFAAAAIAPELGLFPFGPVAAEAMWRSERLAEAEERLSAYEAQARKLGRASSMLGASRVRGLLEASRGDDKSSLRAFEEGSAIAGGLSMPLEVGRLRAAHGAVLAEMGSRRDALRELEHARALFEATGARPYLERVEAQLARLGHRARRRAASDTGLTPTESVVARLVASGLSNRQVADRLVVSRKAIEYHLANIYAKLGVSSRSQLGAKLRSQGP